MIISRWAAAVALAAVVAAGCTSTGKPSELNGTATSGSQIGSCQHTPTFKGPSGQALALVIFPNGTSDSQLLAASQRLLHDFNAHTQSYIKSGMMGVVSDVCIPPSVQVFYRSNLNAAQLGTLRSRLLAETGAATVDFGH